MPKTKPKTPKQLQARIAVLRKRIASWKCDALLVTNPRDIRYLTGFIGDDSWALVRARSAQAHVISDSRFEQQIKHEAPHVTAIMRKTSLADVVKNLADRCGLVRIALQSDYLTVTHRKTLSKKMGASMLKNVDDGMLDQRAVKDGREILAIREALAIQQEAFRKTLRFIKPGRTEYEIAAHGLVDESSGFILSGGGRKVPVLAYIPSSLGTAPGEGEVMRSYNVSGMCCGSCTRKLHDKALGLEGVKACAVGLVEERVVLIAKGGVASEQILTALNFDKYRAVEVQGGS